MPRSQALSFALIALAVLFVVIGVLYYQGTLNVLTRSGAGRHTTHAILMAVLAVGPLGPARFTWPGRSAACRPRSTRAVLPPAEPPGQPAGGARTAPRAP